MISLVICKTNYLIHSRNHAKLQTPSKVAHVKHKHVRHNNSRRNTNMVVKGCGVQEGDQNKSSGRRSFLSSEEAGLVEVSGLSSHERFLSRLTISSLNLLRVISEQEGCSIEELNAGRVCDWFLKDKLKREQNIESAVLRWDDSEFQF